MNTDEALRQHVIKLLTVGQAHMTFDDAVKDFPLDKVNEKPPNVPYTPWHLVEHLRISQWDILDYIRNRDYQYMEWPKDYWPAPDAVTDAAGWQRSIDQFRADLEAIVAIVRDPQTDLLAQIPHGEPGHTVLREALLVADHNAYHIGELGILRQVMGAWPAGR
ncbi:MAG TPA: DinB family protein [Spirillospora sp.]|nr:DinB family protein [Spirillospora sp.]